MRQGPLEVFEVRIRGQCGLQRRGWHENLSQHLVPNDFAQHRDEIPHDGLFSIITMKPYPTHVFASPNQKEIFGCEDAGSEGIRTFDDYIARFHTASVMKHIRSDIMPRMHAMEAGEVYTPTLDEFVTPKGPKMYDVGIWNIGRSCMAVDSKRTVITRIREKHKNCKTSRDFLLAFLKCQIYIATSWWRSAWWLRDLRRTRSVLRPEDLSTL